MTVYDLIRAKAPLDAVRISRGGLDVLPAGPEMAMADLELGGEIGRERKLEKALKKMDGYDFVVIDCPPALNLLTINALTFAREVWIPLEPEFYALEGVTQLLKTVDLVKDSMNPELAVTGVVVTKYNASRNLTKEVESQIREHFKDRVFRTRIRVCVALAEAPASGQTIFEYDSKSNGAVDYESLCQEIVKGDRQ
jgi:chromosome partitioning protein